MYLDDGLGGANKYFSAERSSSYIRTSLSELGFLIAEDKCIWYPQQDMIWIGLVWDMKSGKFRISNERVDRLVNVIEKTFVITFIYYNHAQCHCWWNFFPPRSLQLGSFT